MPRCWAEVKYLGWSDGTRCNIATFQLIALHKRGLQSTLHVFSFNSVQEFDGFLPAKGQHTEHMNSFFCHCFCYLMLFQMLLFYLKDLSVLKGLFTLRIVGNIIDFLYLRLQIISTICTLYLRYYQHRGCGLRLLFSVQCTTCGKYSVVRRKRNF